MRKTYQLNIEGKHRERLLDASKHDIRKYLRRERRKALPAGADFWDFDMRAGTDEGHAAAVAPAELIHAIDALVAAGNDSFYVEIFSKPGKRSARAPADVDAGIDDAE